jgi:hypothetical protein
MERQPEGLAESYFKTQTSVEGADWRHLGLSWRKQDKRGVKTWPAKSFYRIPTVDSLQSFSIDIGLPRKDDTPVRKAISPQQSLLEPLFAVSRASQKGGSRPQLSRDPPGRETFSS